VTNGMQELDEAGLFHYVIRELQRSKMNKLWEMTSNKEMTRNNMLEEKDTNNTEFVR
jgi:hypothetical protein